MTNTKEENNMKTVAKKKGFVSFMKPMCENAIHNGEILENDGVYYAIEKRNSEWSIYELTTGLAVHIAKTRKECIEKAIELTDRIKKAIKNENPFIKVLSKKENAEYKAIYDALLKELNIKPEPEKKANTKPKAKANTSTKPKTNAEVLAAKIKELGIKEEVKTYQQWLKAGKRVRKGSKALFKCLMSMKYHDSWCKRNVAYFGESQVDDEV